MALRDVTGLPGDAQARAMLRPYDAELMKAYDVNRAVNSVKNDTEACIEPVEQSVGP